MLNKLVFFLIKLNFFKNFNKKDIFILINEAVNNYILKNKLF